MDPGWLAAVSGFAVAMAGTPGPNNTMLAASGANYGFRRSLPHMAGAALGVALIILAAAALGAPLAADPGLRLVVKWAGLAYLVWLAWKIASARPAVPGEGAPAGRPLTLAQGAAFQLVNPKLWSMVAGAVAAYGGGAGQGGTITVGLAFGIIFGTATLASAAAWTLAGLGAGRLLRTPRQLSLFNRAMAALLLLSLIPVLAE